MDRRIQLISPRVTQSRRVFFHSSGNRVFLGIFVKLSFFMILGKFAHELFWAKIYRRRNSQSSANGHGKEIRGADAPKKERPFPKKGSSSSS
jgi:hypothetical protein